MTTIAPMTHGATIAGRGSGHGHYVGVVANRNVCVGHVLRGMPHTRVWVQGYGMGTHTGWVYMVCGWAWGG